MLRFTVYGLPLVFLLLALHGAFVDAAGLEPGSEHAAGVIVRWGTVAPTTLLVAWTMEALGLVALFLMVQGRLGAWWLDGLVAGGLAWVFRGPLLVLSVVLATGESQEAWWRLGVTWLVLYVVVGLTLGMLADRQVLREHSSRRAVIVGASGPRRAAGVGFDERARPEPVGPEPAPSREPSSA